MTIDKALKEWASKHRRMGCVAASEWFCRRVEGFVAIERFRFTPKGEYYAHTVCIKGQVIIDLSSYADLPHEDTDMFLPKKLQHLKIDMQREVESIKQCS